MRVEEKIELIIQYKRSGLLQPEVAKALNMGLSTLQKFSRDNKIRWDRGAQLGSKNAQVTGLGRTTIKRLTRKVIENSERSLFFCECCKLNFPEELPRHHKDRDRSNNDPSNLEVLCHSCHALEHLKERIRNVKTGTFDR